MTETFFRHYHRDDEAETEILVEIAVNNWGCAAQIYGPAENCYPAEGMECEIVKAWLKSDEKDAPEITLTDAERERIETHFAENPPEQDDGPDYDYD